MYSANQLDCLNELGIKLYDLKEVKPPLIPESLQEDLTRLFPDLRIDGQRCQLTASFSWLIEPNSTRIIATKSQIISNALTSMTWRQKKDFWLAIQSHSEDIADEPKLQAGAQSGFIAAEK